MHDGRIAGVSRRAAALGVGGLAAALLGTAGGRGASAGKGKKKPKKCPPTPEPCPGRTCCICSQAAATPGCRIGRAIVPGENTADVCDEICGFGAWNSRIGADPGNGKTVACLTGGRGCEEIACPLI